YRLSFDSFVLCVSLVLSFIFTTRRAPRSTLFPYTTLFRSVVALVLAVCVGPWGCALSRQRSLQPPSDEVRAQFNTIGLPAARFLDRKSTRLNSSHEWISYAVFCLKKKKHECL